MSGVDRLLGAAGAFDRCVAFVQEAIAINVSGAQGWSREPTILSGSGEKRDRTDFEHHSQPAVCRPALGLLAKPRYQPAAPDDEFEGCRRAGADIRVAARHGFTRSLTRAGRRRDGAHPKSRGAGRQRHTAASETDSEA